MNALEIEFGDCCERLGRHGWRRGFHNATIKVKDWNNMATLDWSQCPAVESIPGKRSGAWVFRDSRTPVSVVFENLEVGASISEIMDWFHLSHEQIVAVIEFAARSLDVPLLPQQSAHMADAHSL